MTQIDNGSEFQWQFYWHVLDRGINHVFKNFRWPRFTGKVERRDRIDEEEFIGYPRGDIIDDTRLFSDKLREWENICNYQPSHSTLAGITPLQTLPGKSWPSDVTDHVQSYNLDRCPRPGVSSIREAGSYSKVWPEKRTRFKRGAPELKLRTGDWVEVRSMEEILRSLDRQGRLEELPFMPQMFQFCGQRFKVFKRAHKTCDTVNNSGGRRLPHSIHLELRCDGEAYGGCQAACLIFWKEAWLRPVDKEGRPTRSSLSQQPPPERNTPCTEADVWAGIRSNDGPADGETRYICQATQLPYFTTPLPWWNVMQYLEDFTSGNVTVGRIIRGGIYSFIYNLGESGIGIGRPLRWLYDRIQALYGGVPYPRRWGSIPKGQRTPAGSLDLQPGEFVRVKSYQEILATLDCLNENRGLFFGAEEVPYCEGLYRVRARVDKYIEEKTGKLKTMNNPPVILEDVWCQARYSYCRMFCPRSIYTWWREIWLERITDRNMDIPELRSNDSPHNN